MRLAAEAGIVAPETIRIADDAGKLLFIEPEERTLLLSLLTVPASLQAAAEERAPHKVIRLAEAIANDFHKFYDRCRILGSVMAENPSLAIARLSLVAATRQVLYNLLEGVLLISAPTSM
jgi:arginyl-tRNA synthetase